MTSDWILIAQPFSNSIFPVAWITEPIDSIKISKLFIYRLDSQSGAHGHMAALHSQQGSVSPSAQSFAGLAGAPGSNPTMSPSIIGAMT